MFVPGQTWEHKNDPGHRIHIARIENGIKFFYRSVNGVRSKFLEHFSANDISYDWKLITKPTKRNLPDWF